MAGCSEFGAVGDSEQNGPHAWGFARKNRSEALHVRGCRELRHFKVLKQAELACSAGTLMWP